MTATVTRLASNVIDLAALIRDSAAGLPADGGVGGAEAVLHLRDAHKALNMAHDALRLVLAQAGTPRGEEMNMDQDIDETIANRNIARKLASDAAARGEPISGQLADLENLAAPFYLGLDADDNNTDLDVYP